ncbi:Putative defective protein IntQ [Pontiella desulfatans]|uniref:Defective protein IntQ n=1 Tax=Pontiella desulfatans TaxID=2750659 RepID=A0A6C2U9G2_PONDE|nr:site-specific integrase [Pontiella desulfatans]VGO16625.1 Putative defective protein IntQ [Pontiella desulfatans]
MGLEIRKGRDGSWRKIWYGTYKLNGKRHAVNLGVKIAGEPPASLKAGDEGDRAFERSRATAQAKLDQIVAEAKGKKNAVRIVEKIYEMQTGEALSSILLGDISKEWRRIPRKRQPSARYVKQCTAVLDNFAAYAMGHNKNIQDIGQVTKNMARAFMQAEEERKLSPKTWNDTLKLLRTTFQKLLPEGAPNPFNGIPSKESETIFREPFSPEELKVIIEKSLEHDFIRPVMITGICTAMRRGDCCLLQWKDVDLRNGFLTVKTSKTGQTVKIPIFPLLSDELAALPKKGEYVFPEQAAMYRDNPDGITWRVRQVLKAAGFKDKKDSEDDVIKGKVHAARETGLRRASIRDFHSFRVTWVTLALSAGVPLELVQKVTGHKTTEVVFKHYFQPGDDVFKERLVQAMPQLLMQGNGKQLAEPPMEYEIDPGPAKQLEKALKLLGVVRSPKYSKQLKEAIQLIASAKQWYDSTVLREVS